MSSKYRIIPLGGGGMDPSTKYGASISMSMDQDYILSVQLLDQDGNALGSEQTVDLPLESVVVGGSYDSATKSLILTLDNGNTVTIPVGDLVSGLQTEITAQNPLSADYLADGQTNKVFTATEQTKLSNIEAGAQVNVKPDWNAAAGTAAEILNKPTIPAAANDATITIQQDGQTVDTFSLNQSADKTINLQGGGSKQWFGTQAEFDALATKDTDTDYFISDKLDYSEIANTPFIATKVSQLQNDSKYALGWAVDQKISKAIEECESKTRFVTQLEYETLLANDALESGVSYFIEGPQTSIEMVVTVTDSTTATYNVYVAQ